ncbi:hypothetical protein [Burkholderia pseudomallei]|uniref:hypothetical protein n=1 Tax=Burkholderia pseudomallei TaxID=28450 RepID=UPI0005381262|nr:hypothetical protein [Burkholderia pseudomallei]KGV07369.1 hypothetical protein X895_3529 [Burkholderia pseudomallei MSHR4503]
MIARLRTAAGNVPLFEQAGAAPGVPTGSLTHAVRPICSPPPSARPTRALFERQARETLARMEVWVVPDAWARFRAGDAAGYRGYRARLARVADAA